METAAAFRALIRRPVFLALATLMLAAGTGATITLFSLVHAVFIQSLPYPEADRLVWLRERHADIPARPVSYPNFLDWQARNESFEAMAAVRNLRGILTRRDGARTVDVAMVTADYFQVIGRPPAIGRDFTAFDDVFGAAPVVIVSHRLRQAELDPGTDPLGATLTLNETSYTIIGVAPPDLRLPGDLRSTLNDVARTVARPAGARARNTFVLFQTSLAVLLLVCAALLAGSLSRLLASDPGFEKDGVLTFELLLPERYRGATLSALLARIEAELDALPGVSAATLTNDLPGLAPSWQTDIAPQLRTPTQIGFVGLDFLARRGIEHDSRRDFRARELVKHTPTRPDDVADALARVADRLLERTTHGWCPALGITCSTSH